MRRAAIDLELHFNTVAEAYRQLAAEGWLELRHGKSARVVNRNRPKATRRTVERYRQRLRELISQMRISEIDIANELQRLAQEGKPMIQAKARAYVALLIAASPLAVVALTRPELLHGRLGIYWGLISFVVSGLAFNWVYHRELKKQPSAPSAPSAELELAAERLPRAVWLATLPPILVAALLWGIAVHLPDLPWARASDRPALRHRLSRPRGNKAAHRHCRVAVHSGLALERSPLESPVCR